MASQTTPIYPSSAEKRKDDNSDRTASNSHAHILPAPSTGHGDQHVKFQVRMAIKITLKNQGD